MGANRPQWSNASSLPALPMPQLASLCQAFVPGMMGGGGDGSSSRSVLQNLESPWKYSSVCEGVSGRLH
jgi:hypothetical protein